MDDQIVERTRDGLVLSTDRSRINVGDVLKILRGSHWASTMPRDRLERAIRNSVCVGVYDAAGNQVAFARVVSDLTTYAYLTDVIVDDAQRGKGIGSWMVETILEHPDFQGLRRIALWTRN